VSTLAAASPELKRLWVRVIKRVHPDLAVDEQDRNRCERLTQQANEAYARGDEVALRAVLKLNTLPPIDPEDEPQATMPESTGHPTTPLRPTGEVSRGEEMVILGSAGVVLCLLLYGILRTLLEEVGRVSSLLLLAVLAGALVWWILRRSRLPENRKATWAALAGAGMIVMGLCLVSSHPRARALYATRTASSGSLAAELTYEDGAAGSPSPRYWDGIKSKLVESWNPSMVTGKPAGATAQIAFTIAKDGSPLNISLRRKSGSPTLDASCVTAVQQVKSFGPPDGGTRGSVKIVYPCSYNELFAHASLAQVGLVTNPVVNLRPRAESSGSLVDGYVQAAKEKVSENWDPSDVIGVPSGATVYIQFIIWPRGNHDVPMTETSSGYPSLDGSCLRAVQRIKTFGRLPRGYDASNMTVFYHCTYTGLHAATSSTANSEHRGDRPSHDSPVSN
jgi:TonB family protein